MKIPSKLIISFFLITMVGCTDSNVRSVPLEKAPFMEFEIEYEGQTLALTLNEKNEELTKQLSCEKVEGEKATEYCEIDKIKYDTTAIWKESGVVKKA